MKFLKETTPFTHAEDNIIKLTGNVSIESPSRLLTGSELIADIDNNKEYSIQP